MKKIDLGQAISILANIGVIAGIVFLAYEIRQNTISAQIESASSYQPSISQLLVLLLEDDDLAETVRKGVSGQPVTEAEEFQLNIFYMSVLRSWQLPYYQNRLGAMDSESWNALRLSLLQTLKRDIGLQRYWRSTNKEEFPEEFAQFMSELMAEAMGESIGAPALNQQVAQ